MAVSSSQEEGGEDGVWLRVRILNSLVLNFSTTAGHPRALAIVWVFNVFGPVEFIHSVLRGSLTGTGGSLGAFWYIPVCYVPLGLVLHYLIFLLLLNRSSEYTRADGSARETIQ